MEINWFPGHMAKALRETEANLKLADAAIYVLDSRAPASCINPSLDSIVKLPIVYVFNKADFVEKSDLSLWLDKFAASGLEALAVNAVKSNGAAKIKQSLIKICNDKLQKMSAKGVKKSIRAVVIGVPNSGKSTIINNLCGAAKINTGNKAGVTRGQQWVRVDNNLEVCDTPGTLYPKLSDERKARHLAFIGSIRDEVLDVEELAFELVKELSVSNKNLLESYYKVEFCGNHSLFMSGIACKRGYLLRGGVPDEERAARAVIDDFRKGRLGKIMLEKPDEN